MNRLWECPNKGNHKDGSLGAVSSRRAGENWAGLFLVPRAKRITFSGFNGNPNTKPEKPQTSRGWLRTTKKIMVFLVVFFLWHTFVGSCFWRWLVQSETTSTLKEIVMPGNWCKAVAWHGNQELGFWPPKTLQNDKGRSSPTRPC